MLSYRDVQNAARDCIMQSSMHPQLQALFVDEENQVDGAMQQHENLLECPLFPSAPNLYYLLPFLKLRLMGSKDG